MFQRAPRSWQMKSPVNCRIESVCRNFRFGKAGPPGQPATMVLDQLQLFLDALAAKNLHYTAVAVNTLTSVVAPTNTSVLVRFTDRDAVLARTDLKQADLSLSNIQNYIYSANFPFPIAGTPNRCRGD